MTPRSQVVGQTPGHAVHVVLHGRLDRNTQFVEAGDRRQEGLVGILARELRHVEEHGRHFDLAVLHEAQEALDLLGGTDAQPLAHGPRGLARPAELRVVGIVGRRLAVLDGVVDIAQVLGEDLGLRLRIADVGVGVLHEIDRPALGRKDLRLDRTVAVRRLEREAHPAAVIPLGNADLHAVQTRGEFQFTAGLAVVAPCRLAGFCIPVGDVERHGWSSSSCVRP